MTSYRIGVIHPKRIALYLFYSLCIYFVCKFYLCEAKKVKKYQPNWKSLDTRPLPQWYNDAKVGIFIHWGVYSVPSFGSEWFWKLWEEDKHLEYVNFMEKNYKPSFTYQDFGKDFTAELFNATKWSLLFQASGAKYVVLTSKHHDGFTLWPSSHSFSWNAVDLGPKIDIIDELSTSIREHTDLKFGLYHSLFEWFNRMYLEDKSFKFRQNNYVKYKVMPELEDIVLTYLPEILWSDGDWDAPSAYWNSTNFIAWLYNDSPVRDTIVVNDRWGSGVPCNHGDFYTCVDRYNPGHLVAHKWENALTLDKTTWGHRFDTDLSSYMTSQELITELVSTVSCNGNILINIGPTRFGTIEPIFEERLRDLGDWLKINGEAIYGSRPWLAQSDIHAIGVWYTQKESNELLNQKFTIYAIFLKYPYDTNTIHLYSLGTNLNITQKNTKLEMLGIKEPLQWDISDTVVSVTLPPKNLMDKHGLKYAWTIKIRVNLEH